VRDLMLAAVEHRFGLINRLPVTIEWLTDNGSCYVAAETRSFARDIGLEPRTTPIESPRARRHRPSCATYHLGLITTTKFTPHKALEYRPPGDSIAAQGAS